MKRGVIRFDTVCVCVFLCVCVRERGVGDNGFILSAKGNSLRQ